MFNVCSGTLRVFPLGALLTFTLLTASAQAASVSYYTINDPADNTLQTPVFNQLLGINDSGVIAGYFGDGAIIPNNGFVYSKGTFTAENFPGSAQTQVVAINNTLSGGSYQTAGFWVDNATVNHGFTKSGATSISVDGPGATFTQVLGLNDKGQAVGVFTAGGVTNGFVYTLGGTSSQLMVPVGWNATSVTATGINNSGVIVGFYTVASGATIAFIDNNGNFMTPADTLGTNPMFFGLNNVGQIVGTDTSNATGAPEGFIYNWTTGTWMSIIDPNESTTVDGFGVAGTTLNGINDLGQVVGFYNDAAGNVDGLLVDTTPEPASIGLVAFAGILLLLLARRYLQAPRDN